MYFKYEQRLIVRKKEGNFVFNGTHSGASKLTEMRGFIICKRVSYVCLQMKSGAWVRKGNVPMYVI